LTATSIFPDNTVLCNFAAVKRIDLLEVFLRGRGRWTDVVAAEAARSVRFLPDLQKAVDQNWLGEPIEINDTDAIRRVDVIRRGVFGGTPDKALQHLGEAQTIYLIQNVSEYSAATWVTDDAEALRYARHRGLFTKDTADLFAEAVSMGDISADVAWHLMQQMLDECRSLRVPITSADLNR
jgi:predicted nucleic acid-binding protein